MPVNFISLGEFIKVFVRQKGCTMKV
jgi:hypothetical protein